MEQDPRSDARCDEGPKVRAEDAQGRALEVEVESADQRSARLAEPAALRSSPARTASLLKQSLRKVMERMRSQPAAEAGADMSHTPCTRRRRRHCRVAQGSSGNGRTREDDCCFLWRATRGHRLQPWRSPYLRWRVETYTGDARRSTWECSTFLAPCMARATANGTRFAGWLREMAKYMAHDAKVAWVHLQFQERECVRSRKEDQRWAR